MRKALPSILMPSGKAPAAVPPAVIAKDTFTGADATNLNGRALTVGGVWTVSSGTWTIQGNKGVCSVSTGDNWITTELGVPSYTMTVDITLNLEGVFVFRFVDDNNYLLVVYVPNFLRLYERVAGAFTQLDNQPCISGATDTVQVKPAGDNIKIYLNGVVIIDFTTARFNTATKAGLRVNNDSVSTFDEFLVTA